MFNEKYEGSGAASPADLCDRYCNLLGLDAKTSLVARQLADTVYTTAVLAGRSPLSQAAACIFMASYIMGHPKTPKEIQAVAHVSDSTIRQVYRHLYAEKDKIITEDIIRRGADVSKLPPENAK